MKDSLRIDSKENRLKQLSSTNNTEGQLHSDGVSNSGSPFEKVLSLNSSILSNKSQLTDSNFPLFLVSAPSDNN